MPTRSAQGQHLPYRHRIGASCKLPTLEVVTRVPKKKNGFEPRICAACGRPFEWRRKWARDWHNVLYCSDKCRESGKKS
ncbi:MAG: DUF2256 domain-containing protein [Acidimicrobiaceae bacterium]